MDRELPDNDSRAKGASWVHGTAGEVDLGKTFRIKVQGSLRQPRGGHSPQPPTSASPILQGLPQATRHEELRERHFLAFEVL